MSWDLVNNSAMISIRLANPLLGQVYPPDGSVMAVVDTGFTGFLLVPRGVFRKLRLQELETTRFKGVLADGREISLEGAFGSLNIPEIGFTEDGLIETAPKIREILVGIGGLRRLRAEINGCRRTTSLEAC